MEGAGVGVGVGEGAGVLFWVVGWLLGWLLGSSLGSSLGTLLAGVVDGALLEVGLAEEPPPDELEGLDDRAWPGVVAWPPDLAGSVPPWVAPLVGPDVSVAPDEPGDVAWPAVALALPGVRVDRWLAADEPSNAPEANSAMSAALTAMAAPTARVASFPRRGGVRGGTGHSPEW